LYKKVPPTFFVLPLNLAAPGNKNAREKLCKSWFIDKPAWQILDQAIEI